jgi:hypothetical protein
LAKATPSALVALTGVSSGNGFRKRESSQYGMKSSPPGGTCVGVDGRVGEFVAVEDVAVEDVAVDEVVLGAVVLGAVVLGAVVLGAVVPGAVVLGEDPVVAPGRSVDDEGAPTGGCVQSPSQSKCWSRTHQNHHHDHHGDQDDHRETVMGSELPVSWLIPGPAPLRTAKERSIATTRPVSDRRRTGRRLPDRAGRRAACRPGRGAA